MAAKLSTIHGGSIPGAPDPEIIADIERLLGAARSGELLGFAYAGVTISNVQITGWNGIAGSRHPLSSAIMMLGHRYAAALLRKSAS